MRPNGGRVAILDIKQLTLHKKNIREMDKVKVHIDVSTPTGRRLLREVAKHPKTAIVEYPLPESVSGEKLYSLKEVFTEVETELNTHYGSNCKLKL